MEGRSEEIRRLQGCINDLVSLLALPAMWLGRGPLQVIETLLDALLGMLRLNFAYARLDFPAAASPVEAVRILQRPAIPKPEAVGRALEPWLNQTSLISTCVAPNPLGEGEVSLAYVRLGLDHGTGIVVVGSQRADFPTDIESLLLRVAVNQAVIELQTAQVRAERQRAEEIDRQRHQLHAQNIYLRQELDTEQPWGDIVGKSKALQSVLKLVEQVAPTSACALIQGETGTGKELIARAIHRLSDRKDKPFVKLNCAAMPTDCSKANCSGMRKGHSRAPSRSGSAALNWPTEARSFSTKSARFPWNSRPSCCACSRNRSSSAWAVPRRSASMCVSWPPRTATWRGWSRTEPFAAISTTG